MFFKGDISFRYLKQFFLVELVLILNISEILFAGRYAIINLSQLEDTEIFQAV